MTELKANKEVSAAGTHSRLIPRSILPAHLFLVLFLASFFSCAVLAQSYTISTVVGSTQQVNIPGTSAVLGALSGITTDSTGNVFFLSQDNLLRLDAITGVLTLVAGNGTEGYTGDNGPATSAQLSVPSGVAVDSAGNLYIADANNERIRKVSGGVITTIAGNGTFGFSGDNGAAINAALNWPSGVAVDSAGNLYIADTYNNRIRRVSNGVITTVAGNGTAGFSGDNGAATSAELNAPNAVALDSAGNLYIADTGNNRIRKVSNGVINTIAGNGAAGFSGDNGPEASSELNLPSGLAVDAAGNVYIADQNNNRIRKVSGGAITTIAGNGTVGSSGDSGLATSASLSYPASVAIDSSGNIYITDSGRSRIRKVSGGVITTVAGNTNYGFSGDNGPATSAQIDVSDALAVDSAGNIYLADYWSERVRKVSNGVITTIAGNGTQAFSGDNGPATSAGMTPLYGVAVDPAGNLYIADCINQRIRKVSNGVITTIAGNGTAGFSGDNGPATSAELNFPQGVAVDSAGNVYVADSLNERVRKVSNGMITTIAGNGTIGFSGDNGLATSAELELPMSVAVDSAGTVYIGDQSQRIRKVSNGVITTIAGNGTQGFSGDNGPATSAELYFPTGVAVDSTGNVYIADSSNNRIRKVSNGVITTIAGNGTQGFSGDNGPATSAELNVPFAVAVDSAGNVYISDARNNRIRRLTPSNSSSCSYFLNPTSLQSPAAGGNFTVAIQTASGCPWTISGMPSWITVSGANSGTGSATVTLVVAGNGSSSALSATISIAGITFTVTQAAGSGTAQPITAYSVPTANSEPFGISTGPDGALWFTENTGNKIGRITTSGTIAEFIVPTANSRLSGITAGPDAALWFVEWESSKIGRITTSGTITEYTLSSGSLPLGITAGPDGALWFTESGGNKIGRITTPGTIAEYTVPTAGSEPIGITAGPDGALWFTEETGNKIGRITTSGNFVEYTVPTASSEPAGITAGPDGALWFTENTGNKIGRITTSGTITEYPLPAGGGPFGITAGPGFVLWFTEETGNKIGRITAYGVITEYPVPTTSLGSSLITAGPDGALWFTEYFGNNIGRLAVTQTSYTCSNTVPPVVTSVNSASAYGGYSYFTSGSWLEIKGTNLADPADPRLSAANPGQWTVNDFNGPNAPTSLDGISVSINGKPAYVWYISPGQLNVQAPEDSTIGNVPITVTNCYATSSMFTAARRTVAPGFLAPATYSSNGTPYMVATFPDGTYVLNTSTGAALGLNSRPAKPGDLIIAYGIGFGDVTPSILPGVLVSQFNTLVNPITLSFGSTPATLSYSGLAGDFVGLYEFFITVPAGLADGDYPINVTQNGTPVPQTIYLTVHN